MYKYLILLATSTIQFLQYKKYLMKAMTMYVAKLFVYFTLYDISGVT